MSSSFATHRNSTAVSHIPGSPLTSTSHITGIKKTPSTIQDSLISLSPFPLSTLHMPCGGDGGVNPTFKHKEHQLVFHIRCNTQMLPLDGGWTFSHGVQGFHLLFVMLLLEPVKGKRGGQVKKIKCSPKPLFWSGLKAYSYMTSIFALCLHALVDHWGKQDARLPIPYIL